MFTYYNKPPVNNRQVNSNEKMQLNIPNIPVLGQLTPTQMQEKLLTTIHDEATAIDFYSRLVMQAPDNFQKEFISEALSEEKEHLQAFTQLYQFLTGHAPVYTITPEVFATYKEGVLRALKDELNAIDFYKRIILSTTDQLIQQTYFFAMNDEVEHATMFSTIYGQL